MRHTRGTHLITVINDCAKFLDKGGQVDTFILDFEKAFDTPHHELLKYELERLKWIDSFLCFRQQRVVVNGVKLDWAPVLSGAPQSIVLGSLLFSLYIYFSLARILCSCARQKKKSVTEESSNDFRKG